MTPPLPRERVICNPASFRNEARYQRICAVCLKPGRFVAHHAVYEQHLRVKCGLRGNALYDTRNALATHAGCHVGKHHTAMRKIKTAQLTDDNIEYGFEKLGAYAYDYFRRYYDDTLEDPRLKLKLEEYS